MALIGNPIVSTDFPVDYASGNGSTTAFTLSVAPASVNSIDVQISGVSQSPQTYSVSGTTLTFTASPPSGTNNIVVRHLGVAGIPNTPSAGSVVPSSIGTGYALWNLSGSDINYTAGNVGIGTATPAVRLSVDSGSAGELSRLTSSNASGGYVRFVSTSTTIGYVGAGGQVVSGGSSTDFGLTSSNNLVFGTGGSSTERMRILSSGAVCVGTTGTGQNTEQLYVSGAATTGGAGVVGFLNSSNDAGADNSPPLVIHKTRATTSSAARFVQFYAGGVANQAMGGIVGNGATNVQFASLSDAREKTNIQPIGGSLDKINALNPVEFDWIPDGSHVNAGFVAQEVEQIFPEFVVENMANEDAEPRKGLTGGMTGGIIAHLVKAIQELNAKVDAQAAEIKALKGTV